MGILHWIPTPLGRLKRTFQALPLKPLTALVREYMLQALFLGN